MAEHNQKGIFAIETTDADLCIILQTNGLCNGKAQSIAAALAGAGLVGTIKPVKDLSAHFLGNRFAGVGHGKEGSFI